MFVDILLVLLTLVLLAICGAGIWTMRQSAPLGIVMTMLSAFMVYAAWHVHETPGTPLREREMRAAGTTAGPVAPAAARVCVDESRTATGATVCNHYEAK